MTVGRTNTNKNVLQFFFLLSGDSFFFAFFLHSFIFSSVASYFCCRFWWPSEWGREWEGFWIQNYYMYFIFLAVSYGVEDNIKTNSWSWFTKPFAIFLFFFSSLFPIFNCAARVVRGVWMSFYFIRRNDGSVSEIFERKLSNVTFL